MGKIKLRSIKKTAETLIKNEIKFSNNFEKNKKILGDSMPSKKIRNQVAGLITKLKKENRC